MRSCIKKRNVLFLLMLLIISAIVIPQSSSKYKTALKKELTLNIRQPKYTVVFHSNNGITPEETKEQAFDYGTAQNLTKNTFTKINYHFVQWTTERDGSGTSYTDEQEVDKLSGVEGAIIDLYAQWEENPIVTFDPKGGTIPEGAAWDGSGSTASKHINTDVYGDLPDPTREGYTFLGWYKGILPSAYQGVEYIESTGTQFIELPFGFERSDVVDFDVSIDSNQQNDKYMVAPKTWNNNNNRFAMGGVYGYNYHVGFGLKSTQSTRLSPLTINDGNRHQWHYENSIFTISDLNLSYDGTSDAFGGVTTNLKLFYGYNSNTKGKIYRYTHWKNNEKVIDLIPCYRKSDNVIGLYDIVNGVFYTNQGSGLFMKGTDYAHLDNSIMIASSTEVTMYENHTLFATWGHNPTVTFDAKGGSVSPSTKTYNYNSYYIDLPTPTKQGYTFLGWSDKDKNYYLPIEYQEAEYIESTGTQFIELPFGFERSDVVDFDVSIDSDQQNDKYMVAPKTWNNNNNRFAMGGVYGYNYHVGFGLKSTQSTRLTPSTINYGNRHQWHYENSIFTISDLNISYDGTSDTFGGVTTNLKLFYGYNSNTIGEIYRYTHWKNNAKVIDLIPCYRKSDGEIGLYDLISGQFYTNSGTGAFNKGNDVNNSIITSTTPVVANEDHTLYALWEENLTFEVEGNPTQWTNQDVTLTVNANVPDRVSQYSFDGGSTWQDSASNTYTANTNNINIKAKNIEGNIYDVDTVNITKIDKTPPTINFASNPLIVTLDESNTVNDLLTASDNESGIDANGPLIYRNVISTGSRTDQITNTNYFHEPGLYAIDVEVSDVAGNTTSLNSEMLVRWPTAGKYVVRKTELDGAGIVGTGLATDSSKMGLYRDNADTGLDETLPFSSKYYYAGKTVNNYFTFDKSDAKKTFRIFNVAVNDNIKLVGEKSSGTIRYGTHAQATSGLLNTELYQTWSGLWSSKQFYIDDADKITFTDGQWAHINPEAVYYIGGFKADSSASIASTVACERNGDSNWTKATSYTGYSALPNVSDYLKTSNQMGTVYSYASSSNVSEFGNNSWMAAGTRTNVADSQWTINGGSNGVMWDRYFYYFMFGNRIGDRNPLDPNRIRVTFYVNEDTILSGSGTSLDPYTVEEDWSWFDDAQVLQ